jgi:hypothetical protein
MSKEENTPYSFKGDNAKLVDSIKSLLALDSKGALVPNGVCGLARQLLESAAERLTVEAQPAAWIKPDVLATLRGDECCYAFGEQSPKGNLVPLFTRSDAGEVEQLREAYAAAGEREHALREELAKVSREKNDVAYRANETFERLNSMTISKATMQNKLKQRLTAAEQRNACYESLLRQIIPCLAMSTNTTAPTYIRQIVEALPDPAEPSKAGPIPAEMAELALKLSKGPSPEEVRRNQAIAMGIKIEPANKESAQ